MGIVITVFIGFVLVIVLARYISNLRENLRISESNDEYHGKYVCKYFDMMKEHNALVEKYKEQVTAEKYWYAKYMLVTEKKLSRAKFTGSNKAYTEYCKLFEERIEGYKETVAKYEEDHKRVTWAIITLCGDDLELSGTKLQKELFEKKCKEEEEKVSYEKGLGVVEVRGLAEECGISVKITNKGKKPFLEEISKQIKKN